MFHRPFTAATTAALIAIVLGGVAAAAQDYPKRAPFTGNRID